MITRPGSPVVLIVNTHWHGVWLYLLSAAHLHTGLYPGPVLDPRTSCRCRQVLVLGYRTRTQSRRAHGSRLTTYPYCHTFRRGCYPYRIRVNRVAKLSPSPGVQLLSTRFGICMSTRDLHNQVADVYRFKLRDDLQGVEGDEVLRRRVENFVNLMRPSGVLVSTFPSP
jgi:hypothetical protein